MCIMGCDSKGCCGSRPDTDLRKVINERKLFITLPQRVEKGWGYELHIHNGDGYCGKILHFDQGKEFSMHFHLEKRETWYVAKGKLALVSIDPDTAEPIDWTLHQGDVIEVYRGIPHKLIAVEESEIFEVSTPDKKEDSYRIWKGDSQS